MRHPRRSSLKRSTLAAESVVVATSLLLSACGSMASETDATNTQTYVDTSGSTIKVGALNSLSGIMAISEVTVRHAIDLAVEPINAAGGVMGKQIQLVGQDPTSSPRRRATRGMSTSTRSSYPMASNRPTIRCSRQPVRRRHR